MAKSDEVARSIIEVLNIKQRFFMHKGKRKNFKKSSRRKKGGKHLSTYTMSRGGIRL